MAPTDVSRRAGTAALSRLERIACPGLRLCSKPGTLSSLRAVVGCRDLSRRVLVRSRRLTRLTGCRFGPLQGACGLPEPATSGHDHQSRGAADDPSRQPWRWSGRWCWWGDLPALRAAFLDGHPACQVGKGIRAADWAPVLTVKLLTIQTEPRAAKLHRSSLREDIGLSAQVPPFVMLKSIVDHSLSIRGGHESL